jgi:hypothetical protein
LPGAGCATPTSLRAHCNAAYPRFALAARIHNVLNPGAPEPVPMVSINPATIAAAPPTELLKLCK